MAPERPRRVRDGARSRPGAGNRGPTVARPLLDVSPTAMDDTNFEVMSVAQARRVLTNGDIKNEVAFQNDVNLLLASLEDLWSVPESRPQPRLSSPER